MGRHLRPMSRNWRRAPALQHQFLLKYPLSRSPQAMEIEPLRGSWSEMCMTSINDPLTLTDRKQPQSGSTPSRPGSNAFVQPSAIRYIRGQEVANAQTCPAHCFLPHAGDRWLRQDRRRLGRDSETAGHAARRPRPSRSKALGPHAARGNPADDRARPAGNLPGLPPGQGSGQACDQDNQTRETPHQARRRP
jgi:hypothetical protein